MRQYFLDNIRWISIMMLFPYHIFMIYNSFGSEFYIRGEDVIVTSTFIVAMAPCFMPLLFVIAGISSSYSLKKRSVKEFIKERVNKLLIPFFFGLLVLVPPQTYFAEKFHNGYSGGYFEQYIVFFSKITDFTGYTGGFTPAHLWFIFFLFVISIFSLPLMLIKKNKFEIYKISKINLKIIILLFIIPYIFTPILNIGGKSFGEFFAYFMMGYMLLEDDNVLKKLEDSRRILSYTGIVLMVAIIILWYFKFYEISRIANFEYELLSKLYGWVGILAFLAIGRHCFNFKNKITEYMSKSSFFVYMIHQTVIIIISYYVFLFSNNTLVQIILIMFTSIPITYIMYQLYKYIIELFLGKEKSVGV